MMCNYCTCVQVLERIILTLSDLVSDLFGKRSGEHVNDVLKKKNKSNIFQ
jgi:hypothetical protein